MFELPAVQMNSLKRHMGNTLRAHTYLADFNDKCSLEGIVAHLLSMIALQWRLQKYHCPGFTDEKSKIQKRYYLPKFSQLVNE